MTQSLPYRSCPDVDCPSHRTPRREDFVNKKLFAMFGVNNVETWIADQKRAAVPSITEWESLIRKRSDCLDSFNPVDLLRRFGQPLSSGELTDCGVPLRLMDPARIRAFTRWGLRFIYEYDAADPVAFLIEGLSFCDYHLDDAQHRWRLACATLLRAWQDRETDGSLADQARALLCRPYAAAIEKAAHDLRTEYDDATVIGTIFNPWEPAAPLKLERVVVWSKTKDGFEAELCPGSSFCPDSFGDHGLEQHSRPGVLLEDALHGTEGSRFRRRRMLVEPLEFLQRGNIKFCILGFVGGQVLFVHRSNLVQPAPPGEKLL